MRRVLLAVGMLAMALSAVAIPCYLGVCDMECSWDNMQCECAHNYTTWCTMATWQCSDEPDSHCCPAEFAVF